MRSAVFALAVCLAAASASAQSVCATPPVTNSVVQFFEHWQDAVQKLQTNAAFNDTAALLPVAGDGKKGYALVFEQSITFNNECPPRQQTVPEKDSTGWHRRTIDSPIAAQTFIAGLAQGTPVGISTQHVGYEAGPQATTGKLRSVGHDSVASPRGVIVVWFDGK